ATDRRRMGSRGAAAAVLAALVLTLPLAALQPFGPHVASAAIIERGIASAPRATAARSAATSVSPFLADAARAGAREPVGVRNLRAWADTVEFSIDDRRLSTDIVSCHAYDLSSPEAVGHKATVISDDDGLLFIQYALRRRGRCIQGMTLGAVQVSPDERTVVGLPWGARMHLHERTPAIEREISLVPGAGGRIVRAYTVNGRPAPYDAAAAAWLASAIPEVLRESGVDTPGRIARLREPRGDVSHVLADIALMHRATGKRTYYEHLLRAPLTTAQRARVVAHARRELAASRDELEAVLDVASSTRDVQEGTAPGGIDTSRVALFHEMARRMSPTDQQHLIRQQLPAADRALLLDIMPRIAAIGSDGDKTQLLAVAIPRYITADDDLRAAFFAAARTIKSSGDLSALLRMLVPVATATCEDAMLETMRTTRYVSADGDRATLLVYMAGRGMLSTPALRAAYAESARTIKSDGDFNYAMSRLLKT
ncbi:MAG: hypothetical protein H0X64_00240, partial [Gemmatimonadaceae bacterium]|nr:hypothetical protein [Gemmatimonadaceae bacterium]